MKRKSAQELVMTHPGAFKRREAIILAICGSGVASVSHYNTNGDVYGKFVVKMANTIIEETENG